jgi:hypothetical protein
MSNPFATLSKQLAQSFNGKAPSVGKVLRQTIDSVNDYGDPVAAANQLYDFQGVRSALAYKYLSKPDLQITDVQIMVFNGLTDCPLPLLQTDKILIGPADGSVPSQWHQIRAILEVDPAGATTTVAAFVIKDPTVS